MHTVRKLAEQRPSTKMAVARRGSISGDGGQPDYSRAQIRLRFTKTEHVAGEQCGLAVIRWDGLAPIDLLAIDQARLRVERTPPIFRFLANGDGIGFITGRVCVLVGMVAGFLHSL